ncbi:MAG: hypothetical protein CVT67_02265 [Actinobacteria bacterium HGW-Actinobacteria-7]|jgi:hypothetical protein|nr:MAG: hypothetical protein CVT67_02265 [Actinobacteria bacterium HGW-Actinobacteria-7]
MTDEHSENVEQEPVASEPEPDKHTLKEGIREGAAKAWGVAVEVGSLLGGESGTIVDAERELAEGRAEELLDRLDGEG